MKIINCVILASFLALSASAVFAYDADGSLLHQESDATLSLDRPDSEDGTLYVEAIDEDFDVSIVGWSKINDDHYEFELELDRSKHRFFKGDDLLYLEVEGNDAKKFASFISDSEED